MAAVGLLGGTFNPPHIGHLVCAMEAREQLGLDAVWLVPTSVPPHKPVRDDPGAEERARLCELAAASEPGMSVSRADLDRPGPSYTVDTLRALHDDASGDTLTFILGGDQALGLPTWREAEALPGLARFAVAEREGVGRQDLLDRLSGLPGAAERVVFFDMPRLDVSSSLIRERVAAGRAIRHLVPEAVAARIVEAGLYREEVRA
ncbi:MAG: nicotinate-nucleotide adenylyltransferase [Solirubrobacteraceae bacterium]|nr:nicotinate-nucleotide adenylyltransferase [Solirubrobacteraceae bacterium]